MNQGKIIVGIAVVLGICAGLAGYWWNYRVGHRALAYWGKETSRLVRLAPKLEYLELVSTINELEVDQTKPRLLVANTSYAIRKTVDLSQARGLVHLRNAILSDDQYHWDVKADLPEDKLQALRFTAQDGKTTTIYFKLQGQGSAAFGDLAKPNENVVLGPLAQSLEQFLARELPRAEQDAAKAVEPQALPAKSG